MNTTQKYLKIDHYNLILARAFITWTASEQKFA